MQGQQGGGGTFLDQPHFIFNNTTPRGNYIHIHEIFFCEISCVWHR